MTPPGADPIENALLQRLLDALPDAIYLKDRDHRFLAANQAAASLRGESAPATLLGKTDFDYFDKSVAQRIHDEERALFQSRQGHRKEEHSSDRHGNPIRLLTSQAPLFSPDSQEIIGVVGLSRPIPNAESAQECPQPPPGERADAVELLKRAQAQLVQSDKMASLGVLTAGIAHEINNPINFVSAGVNSMRKDFADVKAVVAQLKGLPHAKDPAAAIARLHQLQQEVDFDSAFGALEQTLDDIQLGAARITEIVAGLGAFSRLGKEERRRTNLHDEIECVLVLLRNKCKSHIQIAREFAPGLPDVTCSPGKLNQAFMNLISNAIDAIDARAGQPQGGTVRIATRAAKDTVSITISDDGIGMEKTVSDQIFDPFFTTKSIGKGTGLGLAITRSIIQEHRGHLGLSSAPGQGSSFTLTLPIDPQEPTRSGQ